MLWLGSNRKRVLMTFLSLVALTFAALQAQALSIGCERVWSGPSATNDVGTCLSDRSRIGHYAPYYIYPGFAALFFVLLLVLFPIAYCIGVCNGSCGCACCFPKTAADHFNGPCCLYLGAFISIIWGAGAMVAIIMGAHTLHKGTQKTLDSAKYDTALYFNNTANQVLEYTLVNNPNAPSILNDVQPIFNIYDNITHNIDDFDSKYLKYIDDCMIVSYCIGWMPFVLLLFTLIFGLCRISHCLPACCSCVYYIVGLVFSLLAIIFLVAAYFSSAVNGEVLLQVKREPGILQWYVVPYFNDKFQASVQALDTNIGGVVDFHVKEACTSINNYCDANPAFSAGKPFFCPAAVTCTTYNEVMDQVAAVLVKNPAFCTPGPFAAPADTACTIASCLSTCTDSTEGSDISAAHTASEDVMLKVLRARNATIARNLVSPMMDSEMITDTLLWSAEYLPEVREGFWMAGTGYFISILVFALGIYVMLRGRIVWGEYVEKNKKL